MIYQAQLQYSKKSALWTLVLKSAPNINLAGVTREDVLQKAQQTIGPKNAIQLIEERTIA